MLLLAVLLLATPCRPCNIVIKGIATVLRENVCYDRLSRQCLNSIIHCPNFSRDCETQRKNEFILHSQESLEFMVKSNFYMEIIKLRDFKH